MQTKVDINKPTVRQSFRLQKKNNHKNTKKKHAFLILTANINIQEYPHTSKQVDNYQDTYKHTFILQWNFYFYGLRKKTH